VGSSTSNRNNGRRYRSAVVIFTDIYFNSCDRSFNIDNKFKDQCCSIGSLIIVCLSMTYVFSFLYIPISPVFCLGSDRTLQMPRGSDPQFAILCSAPLAQKRWRYSAEIRIDWFIHRYRGRLPSCLNCHFHCRETKWRNSKWWGHMQSDAWVLVIY
jgi:hypothetical protein